MDSPRNSRPPLDADCQALLDGLAAGGGGIDKPDHHQMRAGYNAANPAFNPPTPDLASGENSTAPGDGAGQPDVPIRIYRPRFAPAVAPALVFFHGGGWVMGDLESHDALCRIVAARSDAVVIAVDYRLAPEHRFPAAVEDCEHAWRYIAENARRLYVDPARLAVGGDSAGGNLAAVIARRLRDAGGAQPVFQALIYPATDFTAEGGSLVENATGYFLTKAAIDLVSSMYVPDAGARRNPDASPLLADDLSGLPPALVQVAGYDPLRDEGVAYADRLREAGVTVELIEYPTVVHGFMRMIKPVAMAQAALDDYAAALRRVFREA